MNLPTTRQLRYFAALGEHLHFGRAAAACFVSQSAFSVAIRDLEQLLGVQLVERTNRRVVITPIGKEVAVSARLCLRDLESLVELARGRQNPLAGPFRLGVIPTIAPFLLPPVLPDVRKAFPELRLFLYENTTGELHARLLDGALDAIIVALPYDLEHTDSTVLFRERFRLACRAGTRHVDPEHYRFTRLQDDIVLLLEDGHCLRDHAIAACRLRDSRKVSRFSASSLLTLIEMVAADLGITFLPEMAEGSALLRGTRVKTWPLADVGYRDIAFVWRRGSAYADDYAAFGERLGTLWNRRSA